MNGTRGFSSIARRIHRFWQWKKLWLLLLLNAAALLTGILMYLYLRETEITGAFVGWGMARRLTLAFWRPDALYHFSWQGQEYTIPLLPFWEAVSLFGRPLLCAEAVLWLLGFPFGGKDARRLLKPLDRMARTAQRLTDEASARQGVDAAKFLNDLEQAIGQIDIDGRLSTGDKDLKGLEDAINEMLTRIHGAYRQQSQFVSDASHELRTPIAVVQGYVRMLDRWGKHDEKVLEESIAAIRSEMDHMQVLVEQLLFLARGDSGRQPLSPEPMDLAALALEVLEEYRMIDETHLWREGHLLPAPVMADPALIKQAARVLVDNAVRYTPVGGDIRISAGQTEDGRTFLEVQDAGIGIGEADIPRIFDRFYRADPARARQSGGSGLGLSVAKWIVDRHGGRFEVLSIPELGSRIRMVLPKRGEAQDTPHVPADGV